MASSSASSDLDRCLVAPGPSPFRADLFKDRVVFITGGGSGIGFRISELFLRHGARVAIVSRSLARLEEAAGKLTRATGGVVVPIACDVRKGDSVDEAVRVALERLGRLDVVVNAAAGNFLCAAGSLSSNAFRTVLEIDTLGTFHVCRAAYNLWMRDHGGGVILNISATLHYRGDRMQVHAGSAKAAIDAMCRHLAMEWGADGVRVNNISPGPIEETEGMKRLGGFLPEETLSRFKRMIPLQRLGTKSDIGNACLFLASDAGSYVTGVNLVVDGGHWMGGATDVLLDTMTKL